MKLQLNFQIVRFLNYKQRFSDSLPSIYPLNQKHLTPKKQKKGERQQCATLPY